MAIRFPSTHKKYAKMAERSLRGQHFSCLRMEESRRVHLPICEDGVSILRPQGLSKTFSMSTRQRLYMVKTCWAVGVGICSMFSSRPLWWDSRKCLLLPHTTDLGPNWTKKRIWSLWFSTEMFSHFWKTHQCCVNVNVLYGMEVGVWYIQTRLNPLVLCRWWQYNPGERLNLGGKMIKDYPRTDGAVASFSCLKVK